MLSIYKAQFQAITKRKIYLYFILILFILMLTNCITNIAFYRGYDRTQMYDPMKLLLVSVHSQYNYIFTIFFPLLATLPAGFTVYHDRHTCAVIFIASRKGTAAYFAATGLAVFVSTFIAVSLPLAVEIGLNLLVFPAGATGDPFVLNHGLYTSGLSSTFTSFLFYPLYYQSSLIYVVCFIMYISTLCGLLALVTNAVALFNIRYRVLLFLPAYITLYITSNLGAFNQEDKPQHYSLFISAYENAIRNPLPFFLIVGLISSLAIVIFVLHSRKDLLL